MKILNVVGARPNLVKIAPLVEEMRYDATFDQILLHTGQHYDQKMSQIFFDELEIPRPDIYLGVGSASHAQQTARIMVDFERVLLTERPDMVVVVGDVNSTLACAITAAKLSIPVAHVEAGLRSFDRAMPEEINRIVTDHLSDLLFTTSRDADDNLSREGIERNKISFVGNVMIDSLNKHRARAAQLQTWRLFNVEPKEFALLTLHRPSNVDNVAVFSDIIRALVNIQEHIPILFPVHPRTRNRFEEYGFAEQLASWPNLRLVDPLGYLAFLDLMMHQRLVLTDSGGVQEETTILGVPCLTLRSNTERPVTITHGTNRLVGTDPEIIIDAVDAILNKSQNAEVIPELWDGQAAKRIVAVLREWDR